MLDFPNDLRHLRDVCVQQRSRSAAPQPPYPSQLPKTIKARIAVSMHPERHDTASPCPSSSAAAQSMRLREQSDVKILPTSDKFRFSVDVPSCCTFRHRSSARPRRVSLCFCVNQSRSEEPNILVSCSTSFPPLRDLESSSLPSGSVGVISQFASSRWMRWSKLVGRPPYPMLPTVRHGTA